MSRLTASHLSEIIMETTITAYHIHIPEDIILQILPNLPSKSLLRFRSVCKSWYTLITHSHEFQLCHLNSNNTHPRRLICFIPRNIFPLNTTDCFWVFDESLTSKEPLPCRLPLEDREPGNFWKTKIIGSSHGVLCLFHPNGEYYVPESRWMQEKYFMFLWNPSIRKYKRVDHPLQVPSRDRYRTMSMLMGFGYASNDRDHKIIVITTDEYDKDRVFLYSLRKSSWTEIRLRAKLKYWGRLVTEDDSGTYFNGAFHWVVYTSEKSKAVIHCSDNYRIMVCFHVERQELYYFDLIPMQMQPYKGQGRRYQPLVYKNILAICDIMGYVIPNDPTFLSIRLWCKKAYRNTSSWTLLFEVQTQKGWLFRQLLYGAYYNEDDDNEDPSLLAKDLVWTSDPHNQQLKPLPTKTGILNQLIPYEESLILL